MTAAERQAFDAWMARQGYAPTTRTGYLRTVDRWHRSRLEARAWLLAEDEASRVRGGPPTERARVYARAVLAWHAFLGVEAPDLQIPRALHRAHPRAAQALSPEAELRLEALLGLRGEDPAVPEPYATALLLVLGTGLRVSEACTARLDRLRPGPDQLALEVVGKGHAGALRSVPVPRDLHPRIGQFLRTYRARLPGPWLFPSRQDPTRPISDDALRLHLAGLARHVGVARLHPHALRHTYATRLAEDGVGVPIIQAALGHRNPATTARYMHPGVGAVGAAVDRVRRR